MDIAQREADEAAGDNDPRDRVWGKTQPDWLTAQSQAAMTARPKPKHYGKRRWS